MAIAKWHSACGLRSFFAQLMNPGLIPTLTLLLLGNLRPGRVIKQSETARTQLQAEVTESLQTSAWDSKFKSFGISPAHLVAYFLPDDIEALEFAFSLQTNFDEALQGIKNFKGLRLIRNHDRELSPEARRIHDILIHTNRFLEFAMDPVAADAGEGHDMGAASSSARGAQQRRSDRYSSDRASSSSTSGRRGGVGGISGSRASDSEESRGAASIGSPKGLVLCVSDWPPAQLYLHLQFLFLAGAACKDKLELVSEQHIHDTTVCLQLEDEVQALLGLIKDVFRMVAGSAGSSVIPFSEEVTVSSAEQVLKKLMDGFGYYVWPHHSAATAFPDVAKARQTFKHLSRNLEKPAPGLDFSHVVGPAVRMVDLALAGLENMNENCCCSFRAARSLSPYGPALCALGDPTSELVDQVHTVLELAQNVPLNLTALEEGIRNATRALEDFGNKTSQVVSTATPAGLDGDIDEFMEQLNPVRRIITVSYAPQIQVLTPCAVLARRSGLAPFFSDSFLCLSVPGIRAGLPVLRH